MSNVTGRYPSYSYTISLLGPTGPATLLGGFSDASGLSHAHKITGMSKVGDITLKRGVVDSSGLWNWISKVRSAGGAGQTHVIIILRDRANNTVQTWKLHNATPGKYTGPPLSGKGNDVPMEELVLSARFIEIVPPHHH